MLEQQLKAGGGAVDAGALESLSRRCQQLENDKALAEKSLVSLQLEVQRLKEDLARKQEEQTHSTPHDAREVFVAKEQADSLRKKVEQLEALNRQQASEATEFRRSLAQWRQHAESATEQASQVLLPLAAMPCGLFAMRRHTGRQRACASSRFALLGHLC